MTPLLAHPSYLPSIFTGVLSNAGLCRSWVGELLLVASWFQVSLLCGFPTKHTAKAAPLRPLFPPPPPHSMEILPNNISDHPQPALVR